ncbi:MAG: hypothetical protein ACFCGT_01355 [Sandaracinaceae bacterium]
MRALLAVALVSLGAAPASADSLQEMFDEANAAYFRGEHDEAAEGYRRLEELGVVDADVAFNLATAEARRGAFGAAIQQFERALWLRPGDAAARAGLAAARAAVGRRRAEARGEAEVTVGPDLGEAVFGAIPVDVLGTTSAVLIGLLGATLSALLFVRRETARLALGIAAAVLTVGGLVLGVGFLLRRGTFDAGERAVVLREDAPLREGPNEAAAVRERALEGQRAFVLEGQRGWARVRVPEVGEGWMADGDVGRVRPPSR